MLPFLTQPAVAPACYVPRERDGASQVFSGAPYLWRTMADGNRRKWTLAWSGTYASGFIASYTSAPSATSNYVQISPNSLGFSTGSTVNFAANPVRAARDPNAFAHHCIGVNTDHATQADRVICCENGARLAMTVTTPCQQVDTWFGTAGLPMFLGCNGGWGATNSPLSGLMAEIYFVFGAQLPPSVFGEYNIHGVWIPKPKAEIYAAIAAAGGWGVNGCHLDFGDPLQPGRDASGQGNHWTAVGFDATGKDTVTSTPTNVYAALGPLCHNRVTEINGGWATLPFALDGWTSATIAPRSGHWYCEVTAASHTVAEPYEIGIARADRLTPGSAWTAGQMAAAIGYNGYSGTLRALGNLREYGAAYSAGSVIGVEWDIDANLVTFYRNGVSQGTITQPLAGYAWAVVVANERGGGCTCTYSVNFGQRPFIYPLPTGAKALCTANLPEPDIKDPSEGLAQTAATGANILAVLDAATAHWTGQWVEIIKRRDAAEDWRVRTSDDPATSWATNTSAAKGSAAALAAGGAYIGYRLRVGARYGIWTAEVNHTTGTATTVTHGLATARAVVIATRVSAGGGDRYMRHPDLTAGQLLRLNSNAVPAADAAITAFEANSCQIGAGAPSGIYRVIVLAERCGFLETGKYIGGGDGGFWPTTTAPEWALIRRIDTADSYSLYDRARSPSNPMTNWLQLNSGGGDWEPNPAMSIDLVVGGLKARGSGIQINASGGQYITVAIGRPIGGVCVAPATAR